MANPSLPTGLEVPRVGAPASAAWLTAQFYNPIQWLMAPPAAFVYASAVQSIPASTITTLDLDSASLDPYNGLGVGGGSWQAPAPGWYDIKGSNAWPAGTSTGNRAIGVYINGTTPSGGEMWSAPTTAIDTPQVFGLWKLALGDIVSLWVYQSSGGSLSTYVTSGAAATLSVRWVHL